MLGVDGELTRTGDAIDLPVEGSPTGPVYTLRVDVV
jgi:hypothetical protein